MKFSCFYFILNYPSKTFYTSVINLYLIHLGVDDHHQRTLKHHKTTKQVNGLQGWQFTTYIFPPFPFPVEGPLCSKVEAMDFSLISFLSGFLFPVTNFSFPPPPPHHMISSKRGGEIWTPGTPPPLPSLLYLLLGSLYTIKAQQLSMCTYLLLFSL